MLFWPQRPILRQADRKTIDYAKPLSDANPLNASGQEAF
jgi:hypothetical protein